MDLSQIGNKLDMLDRVRTAYKAFLEALDECPPAVRRELLTEVKTLDVPRDDAHKTTPSDNGSHKKYAGPHAAVVGILTGKPFGLSRKEIVRESRGTFHTNSKNPDTVIYSEVKNMLKARKAVINGAGRITLK